MEITIDTVGCGKNAIPQRFAVAATAWIVLGSSSGNVCAQSSFNHRLAITPVLESGFMQLMSEFETFAIRTNPPAIFMEQFIEKPGGDGGTSAGNIIQDPAMVQADPPLIHSEQPASFVKQGEGALAKVSLTDGWTPVLTHTPNSVTLWDEIAPPLPSPVPAEGATEHSTSGDVANTQARTTR